MFEEETQYDNNQQEQEPKESKKKMKKDVDTKEKKIKIPKEAKIPKLPKEPKSKSKPSQQHQQTQLTFHSFSSFMKKDEDEEKDQGKKIIISNVDTSTTQLQVEEVGGDMENSFEYPPVGKKRGRKPNGGRLLKDPIVHEDKINLPKNIILHLKCTLSDLNVNQLNNASFVSPFSLHESSSSSSSGSSFIAAAECEGGEGEGCGEEELASTLISNLPPLPVSVDPSQNIMLLPVREQRSMAMNEHEHRVLMKKLKELETSLSLKGFQDKTSCSSCFYDTCIFQNTPFYIPKYVLNDVYYVYGCFCSAECAAGYLMKENIDRSARFQRYALLNRLYGKGKQIKPAPNPHYMLDKYLGNLTIQQYRSLFESDRFFIMIDKPLTHIIPELVEDNHEHHLNFSKNIYSCSSKKEFGTGLLTPSLTNHSSTSIPSKSAIVHETFHPPRYPTVLPTSLSSTSIYNNMYHPSPNVSSSSSSSFSFS